MIVAENTACIFDSHVARQKCDFYKPQPCEDAISRQAVLNLINADWKYEGLEEDVSSLSPVTPQPKTGHWIKTPNGFKCSKCLIVHSHTSIFCPSCGAKMVEQETKINEDISKGFEEFTRMMFRQGQEESEENKCR